ncbi:hypothetical protein BJX63DRAFT_418683 [Aspergillus granulosus]|uniref:Nucleoside phosphorylase domain-containing protein n=1 Tax=Aspergillus granulosus TaxID=176169 RepID=A0ABR4HWG4_9EURO
MNTRSYHETTSTRVLDEEYDESGSEYATGRIHNHEIVICCLPAGVMGTNAAAAAATRMISAFPSLTSLLLVGIAGGAPSDKVDIRLGDVAVSQPLGQYGGVVQYDFGKTVPGGFQRIGSMNAPSHALLTAVSKFKSSLSSHATRDRMRRYLVERPSPDADILFEYSYDHAGGETCSACRKDMIVKRPQRDEDIGIFFGTIASGNQVIKYGRTRDAINSVVEGALCFEMEAAGVVNLLPCLVIRGICDYADSHKNKLFQPFAALAAAAVAREILTYLPFASDERGPCIHAESQSQRQGQQDLISVQANTKSRSDGQIQLSPEQQQLYHESLGFEQLDSRHRTVRMAHSKTCQWILTCPEYKGWLNPQLFDQHHGFLWIKGKPGAGKSTLMKFAFTRARKLAGTTVVSFFFNARGDTLEKTVTGMLRALLYQLLDRMPGLRVVFDMLPAFTTPGQAPDWDVETLKYLLQTCVERLHLDNRPVMCFIDALDECDEEEIRDMLSFFEQLGELASSNNYPLLVCLSSRHYPHVTIDHKIELVLEDQDGHQQDIANYVHSELKAGRSKKTIRIKDDIITRASGVFLWVVLVVQILNKECDRGRVHILEQRLKEIPDGLHSLLKDILTRDNNDMATTLLCLQWILYAKRPLSREEVYFALLAGTMSSEDLSNWTTEEVDEEAMKKLVLDSSKGLAELTKSKKATVQFIHESVRDFLNNEDLANMRVGTIAPGPSHEALKNCCLKYVKIDLSIRLFHFGALPPSKSNECRDLRAKASLLYPFLQYAVENTLHHANMAGVHGTSQTTLLANFPFDTWILKNNLYQKHDTRRYKSGDRVYIFAERNHAYLLGEAISAGTPITASKERDGHPFLAAVRNGNVEIARALLRMDSSLSGHLDDLINGSTLLLYASQRNNASMVELLLEFGAIDHPSKNGWTALHYAAHAGHQEVLEMLLDKDVDARDISGRTPLALAACSNGPDLLIPVLVAAGADLESKCKEGRTPLSYAAGVFSSTKTAMELLLERGADINSEDNYGRTPLIRAAQSGALDNVATLINKGVNMERKDNSGWSALFHAIVSGNELTQSRRTTQEKRLLIMQDQGYGP